MEDYRGLIRPGKFQDPSTHAKPTKASKAAKSGSAKRKAKSVRRIPSGLDTVIRRAEPPSLAKDPSSDRKAQKSSKHTKQILDVANIQKLDASELEITALDLEQPPVPHLSYGLERVLFNPGVYHLQDPRSRVYNFDPYLQSIMPVTEFDFNALKEYITSSRDTALRELAESYNKRYVGSSSSMTAVLAHFHFLLSQWRDINTNMLSREFPEKHITRFTELQRTPSAVFLKWRNGSYAIDADKEFANANILMSLGKSMEKLLTLGTEDFEKYRKSSPNKVSAEQQNAPESYHYSTMGDFIMRSQLDAHDPRLPGTGMFDLKTRAVVSVRMDMDNYEESKGYQIRSRQGAWESFEREYFDMIRAAFLKYSLQVRMGRMDGIFVAFHNIDRIFGFQYISLAEMDSTLHSQWDTTLGDQEFKLSISLLNDVLNKATEKYPNTVRSSNLPSSALLICLKSLRLHFETREAQTPFMYIFAEPVTEDQITAIQTANDAKIQAIEEELLGNKKDANDEEVEDQGWENLQANVRDAMDEDIRDPNHEEGRQDLRPALTTAGQEISSQGGLLGGRTTTQSSGGASAAATVSDHLDQDEEIEDEDEGEEDEEEMGTGDAEADEDNEAIALDENLSDDAVDQDTKSIAVRANDTGAREAAALGHQGEEPSEFLVDDASDQGPESRTDVDEDSNGQDLEGMDREAEVRSEEASAEEGEKAEGAKGATADEPEESTTKTNGNDATEVSQSNSTGVGDPKGIVEKQSVKSDDGMNDQEGASGVDFPPEADVPFIESIARTSDPPSDGNEVLAMTLTIRNKVNNSYVLRPNNLGPKDKWTIEYSLDEVSSPNRAWSLYQACQMRRRKKLDEAHSRSGDDDEVDSYIRRLREMSRKGAKWRRMQDEKDKASPVKVLGNAPQAEMEDVPKE